MHLESPVKSTGGLFGAHDVQPIVFAPPPPKPQGAGVAFTGPSSFNVRAAKDHESSLLKAVSSVSALSTPVAAPEVVSVETPHVSTLAPGSPAPAGAASAAPGTSYRIPSGSSGTVPDRPAASRPIAKHYRSLLFEDWSRILSSSEWTETVNTALYKLLTPVKIVSVVGGWMLRTS